MTDSDDPAPRASSATGGSDGSRSDTELRRRLSELVDGVESAYRQSRRVLSFHEYLELFAADPSRNGRNAATYVRDMFDHFGTRPVQRPWGEAVRFRLFDAPWQLEMLPGQEPRLVGQERLQSAIYRGLCNFAREGQANRLILMHGPNGSSKSTVASCMLRALEHYSAQDEGALYRFHWLFPRRAKGRGTIGFGSTEPGQEPDSYAHLDEEDIDARLVIELRDHPLFLLPVEARRGLLDELYQAAGADGPPEWLVAGQLSHKNKQVFEALLATYGGALRDVLRHVQVERYFISRRYRIGAVTAGPQMTVDAGERQITADRSVTALPTFLQATTLFEAFGELVDAAGGVLEFSDLLKRPIDAFRYLQLTLETGAVSLPQQTLVTNVVMLGSANEIHLAAFRGHPEWASFRGRLELVRVPYLRSVADEKAIYDEQIVPQVHRHVAPHATVVAAEFAVLTRLRRPGADGFDEPLGKILADLTAVEKMDLYSEGVAPERLDRDQRKRLKANVAVVYQETESEPDYEGRTGASPRAMRTLLLDAAQSVEHPCLSPFAVLDGLEDLCRRKAQFEWLKLEAEPGGYHDAASFREQVRERLYDRIEVDLRHASGLIEDVKYRELFERYVRHVSVWTKNEKVRNPVTGRDEDPDEGMMREVESLLGVDSDHPEHRRTLISMIAAWAIDHADETPTPELVFPGHVKQLQAAAFAKLRKQFAALLQDMVAVLREDGASLDDARRRRADEAIERAVGRGYCQCCVRTAVSNLLGARFRDLIS